MRGGGDSKGDASKFTIVLYTHGDELKKKTIEEYLEGSTELRKLNNNCGNRYHIFNNKEKDDQTQVTELLRKIDEMVEANGGGHYTSKMHQGGFGRFTCFIIIINSISCSITL
uniref:AIG1-type G domain-containing protein n=1 Tax=Esox lucius TaxID=8010 RepID=A0A3P8ZZN7_ESOLU